ncbi:hypothetical protein PMIN04_011188 [Paraphaeosphaeria minitans]
MAAARRTLRPVVLFPRSHEVYGTVKTRKRYSVAGARWAAYLVVVRTGVVARAGMMVVITSNLPHEKALNFFCSLRRRREGCIVVGATRDIVQELDVLGLAGLFLVGREAVHLSSCPLADHHKIADLAFPQRNAAKHDEGPAVHLCRAEASSCGTVRVSEGCRSVAFAVLSSGPRRRAVRLTKAGSIRANPTLEASRSRYLPVAPLSSQPQCWPEILQTGSLCHGLLKNGRFRSNLRKGLFVRFGSLVVPAHSSVPTTGGLLVRAVCCRIHIIAHGLHPCAYSTPTAPLSNPAIYNLAS